MEKFGEKIFAKCFKHTRASIGGANRKKKYMENKETITVEC